MPDHLILPPVVSVPSRRVAGAGGSAPPRNNRTHGRTLSSQVTSVVSAPRKIDAGVDPDLVFKIKSGSRPTDSGFAGRGLEMLSETKDFTYFVLSHDEGRKLQEDLVSYTADSTLKSFFDQLEMIEAYGPEDRVAPSVPEIFDGNARANLDVTLWPSSTIEEANRRASVLRQVAESAGCIVRLQSITARRAVLRIESDESALALLASISVVESIRVPPVPFLDFREWRGLRVEDLDIIETPSADVGLLDDKPADAHPMIEGTILSNSSIAPESYPWQQPGNHGTEVAGRLLFPDLAHEIRDSSQISAQGKVHSMRILEPDHKEPGSPPKFADFDFPHNIVERSIRHLNKEHGVRVFNLSVGYSEPYNDLHLGPLTEVIDELVRDLNIIVVVPSGNAGIYMDGTSASGHHVVTDKPNHFFTPEHRMSEPGPAALAVTVGSVALSGAPAEIPNRFGSHAVANAEEISPFSRSGPGIGTRSGRHNKPDVVHYGGNFVINDLGHLVKNDLGTGVLVPSFKAPDQLLASASGTSFAVPVVARIAADVLHAYPDSSANLIRALVASGSSMPAPAFHIKDPERRSRLYGNGIPTSRRSIESGAQRATMTFDGQMDNDSVSIHPIPMPEAFRRGSGGERSIQVVLAFDPPVRRQRREYLAASMKFDIYRQIELDQLRDMLERQDPNSPLPLISDKRRLDMKPGSTASLNSTLQLRRWSRINTFVNDDDVFYLAVTHTSQTWARSNTDYKVQKYALAVTLEDHQLVDVDLRQSLAQQVSMPARVRIR